MPESPFWLTANNKYEQAEADIARMAAMNGVEMETFTLERLEKHKEAVEEHSKADNEILRMSTGRDDTEHATLRACDEELDIDGEGEGFEMEEKTHVPKKKPDIMFETELKAWHILWDPKLRRHAAVASIFW